MNRDKVRLRRDRGWCNGIGQGRTVLDRIRSSVWVEKLSGRTGIRPDLLS